MFFSLLALHPSTRSVSLGIRTLFPNPPPLLSLCPVSFVIYPLLLARSSIVAIVYLVAIVLIVVVSSTPSSPYTQTFIFVFLVDISNRLTNNRTTYNQHFIYPHNNPHTSTYPSIHLLPPSLPNRSPPHIYFISYPIPSIPSLIQTQIPNPRNTGKYKKPPPIHPFTDSLTPPPIHR